MYALHMPHSLDDNISNEGRTVIYPNAPIEPFETPLEHNPAPQYNLQGMCIVQVVPKLTLNLLAIFF